MKNYQLPRFVFKGKYLSVFTLVSVLFFGLIFSTDILSQVVFTHTTTADFIQGYTDNVAVSGNQVYLNFRGTQINNWVSATDLPQTLTGHQVTRWRSYVYLSGGYNGTNYSDAVYRATMQTTGNSTWTSYDPMPDSLCDHAMVANNEFMYIIGGRKDNYISDKIYFCKINSDGTLGEWTESAVTLPQPLWGHTAVFLNGYIYVAGGTNSSDENTANSDVCFAKIVDIDGNLSNFTAISSLPQSRNGHSMICYGNRLIVMGGYDNSGTKHNTVYYADLNLDGTCSAWSTATALPADVSNHGSTCRNGFISVIGGEDAGGVSDKVYYANIDDFPSLTWVTSPDLLNVARKDGAAYASDGQIMYSGGVNISGEPIVNTRYAALDMTYDKVLLGSYLSIPFYQLGEERDMVSLTYDLFSNPLNEYTIYYRVAGSDGQWEGWTDSGEDNPVVIGQHKQYLQYLIKYNGTGDPNIVLHDISLNISGYTQLSGTLNGIDTLKLIDSPFWAIGNISFTSGTHVIEAGVEILFSANTGLEIGQANILFDGSVTDSIKLTSYTGDTGIWNGVYFNAYSDNGVTSTLNYVIIEKAGNGDRNANLYSYNSNEPQINHSVFRQADGYGIKMKNAGLSVSNCKMSDNTESGCYIEDSSPSFSGTDFLSNNYAGIYLFDLISNPNYYNCVIEGNYFGIFYPSPNFSFPVITGITSYNNTISGIAVAGGEITSDQTWPFNTLKYAVVGDITIAKQNDNPRLTIAPGNTIYFDTAVQIQVGKYIAANHHYGGELFAEGKADSLITFTSLNGLSGGWDGIYFHYDSDHAGSVSELEYCTIENGKDYNIKCEGTLQPTIANCTVTNSTGMDIYVQDPNSVPHITSSTTTVYVDGGTQSIDKIWYNFGGGDYIILNDIIVALQNSHVRLTIEPGVTIKADTSVMLQIGNYIAASHNYGGELYAAGTTDSIIHFTSLNGLSGGWDGLYFHYNSDAFGSTSLLKYCTIEKGKDYNVKSDGSAEPRIDRCTIQNSNGSGYDIYAVSPNDVQYVTNTTSTVYVGTGTQSINKEWHYFGGDYIIVGDIIIGKENDKVRLTIEPGNTVKTDTTFEIQVGKYIASGHNYGGEFYAEGTTDSLIIFTSRNNLSGGWDGIYFHYNSDAFGSTSSLKYCTIENGKDYNVKSDGSAEPRIDRCTIQNSNGNGYDIYAVSPNDVQYVTNTTSTVYVGTGTQSINKEWHYFGGDYIIVGDIIIGKENDKVRLTIEPGNTVKTDTTFEIQVGKYIASGHNYGGELYAEGTTDSIITFTSRNSLAGGWDGIYFHYNSDLYGSTSSLKFCSIDNGDQYNIFCENTVEPRIDSCTIINSDGYDIYALNPNSVPHVTATNSTVFIGEGTQSIDKTWYNFGGDYVVVGNASIGVEGSYCTLTVKPGNIIKFDSAITLQIGKYVAAGHHYGGELIAEGTYDSLITFTSLYSISKRWNGIYFHQYADNYGGHSSMKYCIIDESSVNNLYCHKTDLLDLEHITVINSGETGIKFTDSSPYLKLCQVINNDSIGILLTGTSNPVIGDTLGFGCDIYDNGDFDVYNTTSNLILARNNFWNTTDSTTIAGRIYDFYDDAGNGIVKFMPVANESFFDNHPPDNFNLLTIADYTVTTDQTPSLTWEVSTDPNSDIVSYYFYYTDDSTWTSNVVASNEIANTAYTIPQTLTGGKWYWWRVKATDGYLTKFSNQTWRFAVSLPPIVPTPIIPANGTLMHENDYLVWLTTTDPDEGDYVNHYHLQVDDDPAFGSPDIDLDGITVDGKSSSISMQISDLPGYMNLKNKNYYWRVSATDGFGVESDFSDGTNYFLYQLEINFKVLLEGPFNGVDMDNTLYSEGLLPHFQPYNTTPWNYDSYDYVPVFPNENIIDWILLELRSTSGDASTATPDKTIFRKAMFVLNNGTLIGTDGTSVFEFPVSFDDNTFIVVYHRNHLEIMTANPIVPDNGIYSIDFTASDSYVYGGSTGYKNLGSGKWGMASGDADANGIIDISDKDGGWAIKAGNTGYIQEDFNMDSEVDNPDKNDKLIENIGKYSEIPH